MSSLAAYPIDNAFSHNAPAIQEIDGVLYVVFRQLDNSIAWCSARAAAHPTWSPLQVVPHARTTDAPVAVTYNGALVVFFKGETEPSDALWYAELIDAAHNTWTSSSFSGTETTTSPGACVLNGTMYVFFTDASPARVLWYFPIITSGTAGQAGQLVGAPGTYSSAKAPCAIAVGDSIFVFSTSGSPNGGTFIDAFQYPMESIFGPNSGFQWYGPWRVLNFIAEYAPAAALLSDHPGTSLILLWTPRLPDGKTSDVHFSRYVIPSDDATPEPVWSPDLELTQPGTGGFGTAAAVAAVASGGTLYAAWRGQTTRDIWFAAFEALPLALIPASCTFQTPDFTIDWVGEQFPGEVTLTLAVSGEINYSGHVNTLPDLWTTITAQWSDLSGAPYSVTASGGNLGSSGPFNVTTYNQALKENYESVIINLTGNISNPPAGIRIKIGLTSE